MYPIIILSYILEHIDLIRNWVQVEVELVCVYVLISCLALFYIYRPKSFNVIYLVRNVKG